MVSTSPLGPDLHVGFDTFKSFMEWGQDNWSSTHLLGYLPEFQTILQFSSLHAPSKYSTCGVRRSLSSVVISWCQSMGSMKISEIHFGFGSESGSFKSESVKNESARLVIVYPWSCQLHQKQISGWTEMGLNVLPHTLASTSTQFWEGGMFWNMGILWVREQKVPTPMFPRKIPEKWNSWRG